MYASYNLFGGLAAVQFRIQDMAEDCLAGVVTARVLLAAIIAWPVSQQHRMVLILLWIIRCGMTLGVMLAYEAAYGLDATGYYRTGLSLNDPVGWLAFCEGTKNITGIVGLLSWITESYSAIKVIFSYVGLIVAYVFYRSAVLCLGRENIAVLHMLGLFPSLLFWTSIVVKDPIVLFEIAIYCYGVARLITQHNITTAAYVAAGLVIASFIRIWLGIIFVTPPATTYVMASRASALTKTMFLLVAIPGFLLAFRRFADRFSLESTEDLIKTTDYISVLGIRRLGTGDQREIHLDRIDARLRADRPVHRPVPTLAAGSAQYLRPLLRDRECRPAGADRRRHPASRLRVAPRTDPALGVCYADRLRGGVRLRLLSKPRNRVPFPSARDTDPAAPGPIPFLWSGPAGAEIPPGGFRGGAGEPSDIGACPA